MTVLTFGEILLRLASPGYSRLFQKDTLEATFCGGEANVAVSLSKFGVDTYFYTKLPANEVAEAALSSLKYFGVDTSKVEYGDGRVGCYYLEKGFSQRSSKVIYDREYSAIALSKIGDYDWDAIFEGIEWFHWTGINPALSDNMPDIMMEACKVAKQKGIIISCDLNYRSKLWDSYKAKDVMKKLMPYVDVCVANEEDAEKMLGITPEQNDIDKAMLNRKGYESVACKISEEYGCKIVAITLRESYSASRNGWSSILFNAKDNKIYHSKKYDIQIVDRVGGGDSFTAGIIYGLVMDKDNQYVVDFATAASCLKHTIEGDFNRITLQEVEALINGAGNGRVQR